eukprot:PhM_4_TR1248/c1_g1_i2/m.28412/K01227/E3.2.1.96; mannosyl-glycoprotein endo-beta-N-acetylglucosaminidase
MFNVKLFMYDLSFGMANALSVALTGRHVEAIWHTSIVINDREFYFDGGVGIQENAAGQTRFGLPLRQHVLGSTSRTLEEFRAWNREMRNHRFGPYSYDLLNRNCNHYTEEAARFLGVSALPETVTRMIPEIMNTPLGQMLRGQLSQFTGTNTTQQPSNNSSPTPSSTSSPGPSRGHYPQQHTSRSAPPINATFSLPQLLSSIAEQPRATEVLSTLLEVLTTDRTVGDRVPVEQYRKLQSVPAAIEVLLMFGWERVDDATTLRVRDSVVDEGNLMMLIQEVTIVLEEKQIEEALRLSFEGSPNSGVPRTNSKSELAKLSFAGVTVSWHRCMSIRDIPSNAFVAGYEADGSKLYVGRCRVEGVDHIGKLAPHLNACNVPHNKREVCVVPMPERPVDVLIIESPPEATTYRLRWRTIRPQKSSVIPETAVKVNDRIVGRAQHAGGRHPGEIRSDGLFYMAFGGAEISKEDKFECLVFEPVVEGENDDDACDDGDDVEKPTSNPLYNIDELWEWEPSNSDAVSLVNFDPEHRPSTKFESSGPRMIVCHDCCGGYTEFDRYAQGSPVVGYTFRHWEMIDTFIYFSHHRVTVPPVGWIDAAHAHGVPILGTFITEWDAGSEECIKFLSQEADLERTVGQLVRLAVHHNFDGWLINIENPLPRELVPRMRHFLSTLTVAMHRSRMQSTVLWYDSVTAQGELRWQAALTPNNKLFFDVCDGIFTDYKWAQGSTLFSAGQAQHRKADVYTGIDVFGRGTYGGGGFQCSLAMAEIVRGGTSAALFAPAWTYEHAGCDIQGFLQNDNRLWGSLRGFGDVSPVITQLPFHTTFNEGYGVQGAGYFVDGVRVSTNAWQHISQQSLLPRIPLTRLAGCETIATSLVQGQAYNGSTSLNFTGQLTQPTAFRLFEGRMILPALDASGMTIEITFLNENPAAVPICFFMALQHAEQGSRMVFLMTEYDLPDGVEDIPNLSFLFPEDVVENETGDIGKRDAAAAYTTYQFSCPTDILCGCSLQSVSIVLGPLNDFLGLSRGTSRANASSSVVSHVNVHLGSLALREVPAGLMMLNACFRNQNTLEIHRDISGSVAYCEVWTTRRKEEQVYRGRAYHTIYVLPDAVQGGDNVLLVPVGTDGTKGEALCVTYTRPPTMPLTSSETDLSAK